MENYFNADSDSGESILSLALLKGYLRVGHAREDLKIGDIRDSVIDVFEKRTGYICRSGVLTLRFNYTDSTDSENRKDRTYASIYDNDSYRGNAAFGSSIRRPLYSPAMGGNLESQRPTSFFYYINGGKEKVEFTTSEITSILPVDFFFVIRKTPLQFMFSPKIFNSSEEKLKKFQEQSITIAEMKLTHTKRSDFPDDIKQALIRMASHMYENPDIDVINNDDSVIANALHYWNCLAGI